MYSNSQLVLQNKLANFETKFLHRFLMRITEVQKTSVHTWYDTNDLHT